MPQTRSLSLATLAALAFVCCDAPTTPTGPVFDSETHWMEACESDDDCGSPFECLCNVCTAPCNDTSACLITQSPSACLPGFSQPAQALCDDPDTAPTGLCLPQCDTAQDCADIAEGLVCDKGLCAPSQPDPEPDPSPQPEPEPDPDPDPEPEPDLQCVTDDPDTVFDAESDPQGATAPTLTRTAQGYAVVWRDEHLPQSALALRALDEQGVPLGGVALALVAPEAQSPHTAFNAENDELGLVWQDQIDGETAIFFARFDTDGVGLSAPSRLSPQGAAATDPVLIDTAEGYAATWRDDRDGQGAIFFARLDDEGSTIEPETRISDLSNEVRQPTLIVEDDGFALAWVEIVGEESHLRSIRLDGLGQPRGASIQVTNPGALAAHPAIAWSGDRFAIAWEDLRHNPNVAEIYLAQLDATGALDLSEQRFTVDSKHSTSASLAWTGASFVLGWVDNLALRISAGVRQAHLAPEDFNQTRFVEVAEFPDGAAGVASHFDGVHFSVAWSSLGELANPHVIGFTLVSAEGIPDPPSQISLSASPSPPDLASVWTGQAHLAAWIDKRHAGPTDSSGALVLSQLDAQGQRLGDSTFITQVEATTGTLRAAWTDDRLALTWLDPVTSQVTLAITNADGALQTPPTSLGASNTQSTPALAWDADGASLIVAWRAADESLLSARVSPTGTPIGDVQTLAAQTSSSPALLALEGAPNGAAWALAFDDGASPPQITLLTLDEEGSPLADPLPIGDTASRADTFDTLGGLALAQAGSRLGLLWRETHDEVQLWSVEVDLEMASASAETRLDPEDALEVPPLTVAVSLLADTRGFVAAWPVDTGVEWLRLSATGKAPARWFWSIPGVVERLSLVWTGEAYSVVWSDARDRRLRSGQGALVCP